jgi:REP element-mobilizing transposase RayT
MRKLRKIEAHTWYLVSTAVNRHEPIFLSPNAVNLFNRTLRETGKLFPCEVRFLVIEPDRVSFYIKPTDGFILPFIMQWLKQTYAVRYNVCDGRTGHIWGDRYWSKIVEGPSEDAEEYVFAAAVCAARRRGWRRRAAGDGGGVPESGGPAADPARDAKGRPHTGEKTQNSGSPPDLPHSTAPTHG